MNVLDLAEWLAACRRVGIPYIGTEKVGTLPIKQLWNWFDGEGDTSAVTELQRAVAEDEEPNFMLRWSMCSGEDIKYRMSQPGDGSWWPEAGRLVLDDCRLCDLLDDWPGEEVTLYKRPWMQAEMVDGYPVEFRVFVEPKPAREPGLWVAGVSSYYPQRPLPERFACTAERCRCMADLLLGDRQVAETDGFTCDWLLPAGRDVPVFLEGGPSHGSGLAHPCCFAPGHTVGVALERQPGALDC